MNSIVTELFIKFTSVEKVTFNYYDGLVDGVFKLKIKGEEVYFYADMAYFNPDILYRIYCVFPINKSDHDFIVDHFEKIEWEDLEAATKKLRSQHTEVAFLLHCDGAEIIPQKTEVVDYREIQNHVHNDIMIITGSENRTFWESLRPDLLQN